MKMIKVIALAAMALFCGANVANAGLSQKDAVNLELIQEKLHKQDRWCEAMGHWLAVQNTTTIKAITSVIIYV